MRQVVDAPQMKRKWAQGIAVNAKFRALRARIISNLGDKERERLTREAASTKMAKEKTLTAGKRDMHKASEQEISAFISLHIGQGRRCSMDLCTVLSF